MEDFSWVPTSVGGTMAGRNPIRLLLDEARRKPDTAALIDRALAMDEAEFATLATPMLWHKKALAQLLGYKARQQAQIDAQGYVDDMGAIKDETQERGIVVRHTGPDTYWTPPKKNPKGHEALQILVKTGDLMFVTKSETWIASTPVGFPNLPVQIVERDVVRRRYFEIMDRDSPAQQDTPALQRDGRSHPGGFTIFR